MIIHADKYIPPPYDLIVAVQLTGYNKVNQYSSLI